MPSIILSEEWNFFKSSSDGGVVLSRSDVKRGTDVIEAVIEVVTAQDKHSAMMLSFPETCLMSMSKDERKEI